MTKKRSYHQYCSLARALDLVGERWTLLIVRDLLGGPRRYKDLQQSLSGIGTNLLANRLKELERAGLVESVAQPPPSSVKSYQLTPRGRALEPTVLSLAHWGLEFLANPRAEDHWQPQWNHVALKARFNAIEANDIDATYAFEIGGYPHYAVIRDGIVETYEGTAPNPDLVLKASNEDFLRIVEGELNIKEAVQSGAVTGSGEALLRMAKIFTPPGD
jgi:DNA-binding HxlR family transcriptional regulator/putative sterol carrier protein